MAVTAFARAYRTKKACVMSDCEYTVPSGTRVVPLPPSTTPNALSFGGIIGYVAGGVSTVSSSGFEVVVTVALAVSVS